MSRQAVSYRFQTIPVSLYTDLHNKNNTTFHPSHSANSCICLCTLKALSLTTNAALFDNQSEIKLIYIVESVFGILFDAPPVYFFLSLFFFFDQMIVATQKSCRHKGCNLFPKMRCFPAQFQFHRIGFIST